MTEQDDFIVFAPESAAADEPALDPTLGAWRVLVVDDDPQVHTVTVLALENVVVDGKPLSFVHAYDGQQARAFLSEIDDWALALVDVVMATEDDGLRLVQWLRDVRRNRQTRVILRTGQPGVAPERDVMLGYDINDYQPKAELTSQRLVTSVVGSIRAWRDLRLIADQREHLASMHAKQSQLLASIGRFEPQEMLSTLGHDTPVTVERGDHVERDMTLMFLDIRSFTAMSERLGSDPTFALLNRVFGAVVPIVYQHFGIVDKYLGDGLLALFPRHPDEAVSAAYEVLERVRQLSEMGSERGGFAEPVQVSIGIHRGPTVLGIVGTPNRIDPTVIADAVNVCARLERLTRQHNAWLLVSHDVFERLSPALAAMARPLGALSIRGKQQPVVCYDLFCCDPDDVRQHKLGQLVRLDS